LVGELRDFLKAQLPDYMVPSAFVLLDAIPLTTSGKVDRRRLVALAPATADRTASFVAPRDLVELQLAQIWEELLDTRPIGVTDNFFELGGHSLLAVRLMAQIQQRFGQRLPLSILFQSATIAHLAEHLRQRTTTAPHSPLVAIQPAESRPPLFCVHPIGGNVLCYYDLAQQLGPDQPLYGLEAPGLHDGQAPVTGIEALAARYIAALRAVQPEGPYRLAGWSFGGIVAFEMAQQLRRLGRDVALVALLDSRMPDPRDQPLVADGAVLWVAVAEDLGCMFGTDLHISLEELRRRAADDQLRYVLEQIQQASIPVLDSGADQLRQLFGIFKAHIEALRNYTPQHYPGRLICMIASAHRTEQQHDPTAGWDDLADGVERYIIPGDHYTMLKPPHVQILAERLTACLTAARGQMSEARRI